MKTKLLIASVFSLLLSEISTAQWVQQTSGTAANFSGITCPKPLVCYVAGTSGVIRKTVNGGVNWTISSSGSTSSFACIKARDSMDVWIGLAQKFHHTSNAGALWAGVNPATSISTHVIYDIAYPSATQFIAVGGNPTNTSTGGYVSLRTTNAGAVWTPINVSGQGTMYGVEAFNDSTYIAVGGAMTVYKTTNYGATWTKKDSGAATTSLYDVSFPTAAVGFAVGGNPAVPATGGIVLMTSDSGNTWDTVVMPDPSVWYGVHFVSNTKGWVVGVNGKIYQTLDGGGTWNAQVSTVTTTLTKVQFVNDSVGYATGQGGVIIKTTNGGYPTSIAETHTANGCTVLGNPARNELKIETDFEMSNASLFIINAFGQQVELKQNLSGTLIAVKTSNLPVGIYSFRLIDGETEASGKFIVE